jgi:hypothetical protein
MQKMYLEVINRKNKKSKSNQRAKRPLQIIGRMFRVEKMLKENLDISSDKALEWRQRVSAKCEQQLYTWCRKQDGQAPPTLKLGQAITYYQN